MISSSERAERGSGRRCPAQQNIRVLRISCRVDPGSPNVPVYAPPYAPEPEVWFWIRHIAADGRRASPVARFRDQTVKIAVGPRKAFETANSGTLTRRVAVERVVAAAPN